MARLPRLVIPGELHLLVQRSHGGAPVFRSDDDAQLYLGPLKDAARDHAVAVHAYAVLPEQVWLLLTPATTTSISRMSQALGRRFGAAYNRRHARTGALWEGRFRATVVDAGAHLLDAIRFVEGAPVHAGLAAQAVDYPWSSAAHHLGRRVDPLITEHAGYWRLGNTPFEREAAHRLLLEAHMSTPLHSKIAEAAHKGWLLGGTRFAALMTEKTSRRVTRKPKGRPVSKHEPA